MRALVDAAVGLLHVRLEVGDRGLHRLGRLQHEGQLHLAGGEQLADDLHAGQQQVVDDLERRDAVGQRFVEVVGRAVSVAVDDALVQPLLDRPVGAVLLDRVGDLDVGEDLEQLLERVVAGRRRRRADRR